MKFNIPTQDKRAQIWSSFFTDKAPLEQDVDFDKLGRQFEISGGYIKNAVLNAVRECAFRKGGKKSSKITMHMLEQSARNEVESLISAKGRIGFCSGDTPKSLTFREINSKVSRKRKNGK